MRPTYLPRGIEPCAALLSGLAARQAPCKALLLDFRRRTPDLDDATIRLELGRWPAPGVAFGPAADSLRTAAAPSRDEIGRLAAIIVPRTVLHYSLPKEIDKAAGRGKDVPAGPAAAPPGRPGH